MEVSSPGVEKPIKLIRQLPKHIGRKIRVRPQDEEIPEFTGTLLEINDGVLSVEVKEKRKEKEIREIRFDEVAETKIIISF